jgi:2-C-methyl-D-erythritol 2,4-cyclodiphosphate synthase
MSKFRSGVGYDVHALVSGHPLILGGVSIDYGKGLKGHSDGDVLLHAIIDSVLGASGLGDIGRHFPSCKEELRGISSVLLLERTRDKAESSGFRVIFVDATIVIQSPSVMRSILQMEKTVACALNLSVDEVNIKATTTDGLGFVGREYGVSCMAVTTVEVLK